MLYKIFLVIMCILFFECEIYAESLMNISLVNSDIKYNTSNDEYILNKLNGEPVLYKQNIGVATSNSGQIAVWSGPAPDENYDSVIVVYNENGLYLYGYEIKERYKNGNRAVFFIDHALYIYSSWVKRIFELDSGGSGIIKSIDISREKVRSIFKRFDTKFSNITIECFDPDSTIKVIESYNGKLIIQNKKRDIITVYDNQALYEPLFQFPPLLSIIGIWIFFGVIIILALASR